MRVSFSELMAHRTSLGVGGRIAAFCEIGPDDAFEALQLADKLGLPLVPLGGGTNILASDQVLQGVVVSVTMAANESVWPDYDHAAPGSPIDVRVYASASWDEVVASCVRNGWQGIECLSGIPGTAGAAPVQNIGAYGQQVSDVIVSVTAADLKQRTIRTFSNEECGFGYRSSIFNRPENLDRYLITQIVLRLTPSAQPCTAYAEVARTVSPTATLTDVRDAVLRIRHGKGMLAGLVRSAGSFFKNPVTDTATAEAVIGQLGGAGWFWPTPDGYKLSAARLIEEAGFKKGHRLGNAGVSPFHSLALVNLGNATAEDICGLARAIQEKVARQFAVRLEPEVRLLGFQDSPLAP